MEDKSVKQAEKLYETLVGFFEKNGYRHDDDPENFSLKCGFKTNDLPADLKIQLYPEIGIIHILSMLPFKLSKDKIEEGCKAACAVNNVLYDGNFIVGIESGAILFKLSSFYYGSIIGEDLIEKLITVSLGMIDRYNDKFLMLEKGVIDASEIVEKARESD
jgi:hypothetical protein